MYSVLLIDDENWVLEDLKTLIDWENYGFQIVGEANDAEDAKIKISELKPDVVISDIRMPGLSGIQLLESYSQQGFDFKTIFVTAYGKFEYAKKALELGADGYLLKPVETEELFATLDKVKKQLDAKQNVKRSDSVWEKTGVLYSLLEGYATDEEKCCAQIDILPNDAPFVVAVMTTNVSEVLRFMNMPMFFVQALPLSESASVVFIQSKSAYFNLITYKNMVCFMRGIASENKITIGLSRVFKAKNKIRNAFLQAEQAGYLSFINHRYFNAYIEKKLNVTDVNNLFVKHKNDTSKADLLDELLAYVRTQSIGLDGLNRIFDKLSEYLDADVQNDDMDLKEIAMRFKTIDEYFAYLKQYISPKGKKVNKTSSRNVVKEITEYIYSNYNQKIMINDLAQQFFLNPSYLSNLFKAETGKSFTAFLVECRLKKAAELLEKSDLTLYEISARVGYEDYFHFSKLFKKHMNVSPAHYRKSKVQG